MNLDDKLKLAHEYAMQAIDTGYVCETDTLVTESWQYADAMEKEYNKRKLSGFPDVLKEEFQPDWSQAPDWANWWAVDINNDAYFYSFKPYIKEGSTYWGDYDNVAESNYARIAEENCKYQGDWKDSLRKRPKEQTYKCNCAHWKNSTCFMGDTFKCGDCGGMVTI